MCLPQKCTTNDLKMIFMYCASILPKDVLPFNSSQLIDGKYQFRCQDARKMDGFAITAM